MQKSNKIILLFSLICVGLVWFLFSERYYVRDLYHDWQITRIPIHTYEETHTQVEPDNNPEATQEENLIVNQEEIPEEYNLSVPFTPQAPEKNWSLPYKEACEEASLLMVYYFQNNLTFTVPVAKREIDEMVDWQLEYFGEHRDLSAQETGELASQYWGYDFDVINNLTIQDIRKLIARGVPVIVPAAGRELGNPYFTPPGPIYHMLVIKGYTKDKFITNDPGTRRGTDYMYDQDILMSAIRDWTGEAADGGKVGLVIKKSP